MKAPLPAQLHVYHPAVASTERGPTTLNPHLRKVAARICTEFYEMPGMSLTEPQVRRLWSLTPRDCREALDYLCESCQLAHDPSGCYLLSLAPKRG